MTKINYVTRYAKNCHGQPNNNASYKNLRTDWSNNQNACSQNAAIQPNGSATSTYSWIITKETKKATYFDQKIPWTYTGHDFNLNIPDCAYIKSIRYTVRMKVSGSIILDAPYARFNIYGGSKAVKTNVNNHNGWYDGFYYRNPNKALSSSWQNFEYVMSGDEFRRRGYSNSELNKEITGIDLRFQKAHKFKEGTTHTVSIAWVACYVEYEMPDESISFVEATSPNNPRIEMAGDEYTINAVYRNRSNAGCCGNQSKAVNVKIPPNAEVTGWVPEFNKETNVWTVNCNPNAEQWLVLTLKDYGSGLQDINFNNSTIGDYDYWVYSATTSKDVGEITPYPQTIQKGVNSCIKFVTRVNGGNDGLVTIPVEISDDEDATINGITWNLVEEESSPDVTLLNTSTDTSVKFSVPINTAVDIVFTGCFMPDFVGLGTVTATLDEPIGTKFRSIDPPVFVVRNTPKTKETDRTVAEIQFNPSLINFITHRVATSTELGAYVIDCGVAPLDSEMGVSDCSLTAGIWQKRNYIGMVELPFSHFDPKSTYENKEIYKNYKNKTYAGKEGSIDEDIDLNFRVPPKDTITLQGLVELDKPTPINANWRCFEGDPLNHRGWAVFSKLEIVEKTNHLWYKCQGTVKYITHDINTKFQIFKELPINNVDMPSIMADTITLGANLSNTLSILQVDTDGGFIYDEDGDDGAKNIFSLDEGQVLSMKTVNPISEVTNFRFDWYSNRIDETRENNLERVYRIRDKDGNSIFEYEYTNFVFEDDFVYCTVLIRVKDEVEGWKTRVIPNVDLRTELEADPIEVDDDSEVTSTSSGEESSDFVSDELIITDTSNPLYDEDAVISQYADDLIRKIVIKVKDKETYLFNQTISSSDSYIVTVDDITLTGVKNNDIISFSAYDEDNEELGEWADDYLIEVNSDSIEFFKLDDENGEAYDKDYIAPTFDPNQYDLTLVYGTSLEFYINKNKVSVYDAGYNGREVAVENIKLIDSNYTFEAIWTNLNQDGTTEDIISYIDVGMSETILSATYAEQYSNIIVSPFPIPRKKVLFTRESEEGTIYYMTGEEPFKYRLEPFYQYLCGTDLVTREGSSIFNLNNSHTYFYIENGLVRLGFNKFSGSLYLAKWDIISKSWITTHYLHMSEDIKFSLESYSDDKIVIKAGDDTYFSIWRGHPYIMIQNQNQSISIDSNFTYCLSDSVDGINYDYPVIASFMNESNLLPSCIGGRTLDYDCIDIDDDDITGGTNHTITVSASGNITAGESATFNATLDPSTTDGEVHYLLDGVDVGSASYPFSLTYTFPITTNDTDHTLQAVYTGDEDDNIAISDIIPIVANAPEPEEGTPADTSYPEITGTYQLKIVSAPSKFTYLDGGEVVLQLTKGGKPVRLPVERQRPDGKVATWTTNGDGKLSIKNNEKSYVPGKYQWGGRFYDNIDADHDGKLMLSALRWIEIDKATPTFTHNASSNKVSKGKSLTIKLNSVYSIVDASKAGISNAKVSYTINGGSKTTKKTNKNGKISIPFNKKGTYKIKAMFAGNSLYKAISKTFTIKVV